MPFRVDHDSEIGIATLTFSGTITNEDLVGSSVQCIALQKATACLRYVIESADWNLVASSVDIYALPTREYPKQLDRRTRIAIVQPTNEKAREAARFYESTCRKPRMERARAPGPGQRDGVAVASLSGVYSSAWQW
jgi:hypothetical protein